jgi:hypothetical protein
MTRAALALLLAPFALAMLTASPARADENSDLDLIPSTAPPAPPPAGTATAGAGQRLYVENAFTVASHRTLLVPFPPPSSPNWEERLFFDARKEWRLGDALRFTYSGRMNLRAEDTLPILTHENIRHDLRETYVSWQPATQSYLDFGRINLKSGVAEGFNPTDFFKTRSVIEPLTADPTVLREDRLGTLMLRGQRLWEHAGLTVAIAPKLYDPSPIYTNTTLPSFDPTLDRTNAHDRFLLKADADLAENVSPELLFYREGNMTRWGANLTESIGQSIVAYGEWSGGNRASLIDDALRYGRDTGTIPANAPGALPENARKSFQNALSLGASYTVGQITFNLEYHYDQAAFSHQDWRNWFRIGSANAFNRAITNQLWYLRSYALDQQEPLSKQTAFLRADWTDAFVPKLELTALANIDLYDGSAFGQVTADYYLSDQWTIGALASADLGTKRSDFGSLPQAASVLVKLVRYF